MNTADIQDLCGAHLINTYGVRKMAITRGKGAMVWDAEGRQYLDFFAGIAVTALGHCHPAVTEAITRQAETLVHVSNLYYTEPQARLAKLLAEHTFAPRWFFANCGATANEAALKLARRYWAQKGPARPGIVAALQSFHGRTFGALTVTGQPRFHEGFEPLLPGVSYVPYNDAGALEQAVTPDVGAVILEPIQGEGGVRLPDAGYLRRAREICQARDALLILDEVQTGMGRTGTLWAYEQEDVTPDIITTAKALGNGAPIGAVGCTEEVAAGFTVGSHATTFGGNPLSAAAALATLTEVVKPGFLEKAAAVGAYFVDRLETLARSRRQIKEIRARGLLIGLELDGPAASVVDAMRERGVLCGSAGPRVLRFAPPLIISEEDAGCAADALDSVLGEM